MLKTISKSTFYFFTSFDF